VLAVLAMVAVLVAVPSPAVGASDGSPSVSFYVSPSGDDQNTGTTPDQPLHTIAAAQEVVRSWTADHTDGNVVVYLRGGTYRIPSPLEFGSVDSGTDGHPVIWRNYPGESPVLSGGTPITGWTEGTDGIWSASAQGLDFLQLYGPDRITRARTPDAGTEVKGQLYTVAGTNTVQVKVADSALPDWDLASLDGVQVVLQYTWRQLRYRIASISPDEDGYRWIVAKTPDGTVNPGAGPGDCCQANGTNPIASTAQPIGSATAQYPVYLEGAKEFINDNEFSLDTATNTVYWKPPTGVDPNTVTVTAPATEQLVVVDGASDLTFYGLQFAHTTWLRPDQEGNMQRQGGFRAEPEAAGTTSDGWPIWYVNPGAVTVQNGHGIIFERDAFRYLGANGIVFGKAASGDEVRGDIFSSISDTGVFVGAAQDHTLPTDEQDINTTISDNLFDHMGEDYATDSAITANYPDGLTVDHNLIEDVHNIGINIGYIRNLSPTLVTSLQNVQVTDNRIDTACTVAADCGAIHTKANFYYSTSGPNPVPRSTISGNYITNVHRDPNQVSTPPARAIYPDDKTSGLVITKNEWSDVDEGLGPNDLGVDDDFADNDTGDQYVIANAGLEVPYQDLTTLDLDTASIGGSQGPGIDTSALHLDGPTRLSPGSVISVTATLQNGARDAMQDVSVQLHAPSGFSVSPNNGEMEIAEVGLGEQAQAAFEITVPADPPSTYSLITTADYQVDSVSAQVVAGSVVETAPSSVSIAMDDNETSFLTGETRVATTSLTNYGSPLDTVVFTLPSPAGWSVEPVGDTTVLNVGNGQTVSVSWNVTAPADAPSGQIELVANAAWSAGDTSGNITGALVVQVLEPVALPLDDSFDSEVAGQAPADWTIDSTGGSALIAANPDGTGQSMRIIDTDATTTGPTATIRFTPQTQHLLYQIQAQAEQTNGGLLPVLADAAGTHAIEVGFSGNGAIRAWQNRDTNSYTDVMDYTAGTWYTITIDADITTGTYNLSIDGNQVLTDQPFINTVGSVSQLILPAEYQTGTYYIDSVTVDNSDVEPVALPLDDSFDSEVAGQAPADWTIDSTGGSALIAANPDGTGQSMRIIDTDATTTGPTATIRFTPQTQHLLYQIQAQAEQTNGGLLPVLADAAGTHAIEVGFSGNGAIRAWQNRDTNSYTDVMDYTAGTWYTITIDADITTGTYNLSIDGNQVLTDQPFINTVGSVSQLILPAEYQTGTYYIDSVTVTA
jgi:beta-glucuronidase